MVKPITRSKVKQGKLILVIWCLSLSLRKKKKKKPLTPRNQKPPLYVRVINRHWYEQTKGINDWILAGVQGMGSRYKPKKKKKEKAFFNLFFFSFAHVVLFLVFWCNYCFVSFQSCGRFSLTINIRFDWNSFNGFCRGKPKTFYLTTVYVNVSLSIQLKHDFVAAVVGVAAAVAVAVAWFVVVVVST